MGWWRWKGMGETGGWIVDLGNQQRNMLDIME